MHSFVARLRARAISQTTTNSNQSEELPDTPGTPTSPHPFPSPTDTQAAAVDRKILPQVHELLESYSIEDRTNISNEQSAGLSPRPLRYDPQRSPEADRTDSSSESPSASANIGKGSIARISRKLVSSTPWSTFGRTTAAARSSRSERPPSSRRFNFGSVDTFANPRPSRSSASVANCGTDSPGSADHQRRPSRASEASSWRFGSSRGRPYPLSAIAQDPAQLSRPTTASGRTSVKDSATTQSSASTKSHAHTPIISPPPMPSGSSSHQTFGNTSPSLHLSAFVTPSTSPIPTMDTHERINTLTFNPHPVLRETTNTETDTTPPLRHWSSSFAAKTFPPRRRRKTVGGSTDENTVPFPLTSGHRLRTSASVPGVRHIFQHQPSTPKLRRRQSSSKSSRRSSADWNARQATAGVSSGSISEYGWPAQVSREIIRLSLGEPALAPIATKNKVAGRRPSRNSANADIVQRGHNVPRSSQVAGRPCPPLFSTNSSPSNLEEHSESGDKPSWSQDVLTHIPVFNRPGGVVEGQRSMSTRNGAELSTLKEEGDDLRQTATFPRASVGNRVFRKSILRHSSSLNPQGSEAGPSSLETTPSSTLQEYKRSSARRPARYASEPSISQIPETPLKNKGKRKAEDLDLTPPDHRISHTTFVIPADHRRTHLQSEPTRAPSAYQHKRVRLSSQSPVSTPSHSRPGSVQQHALLNFTDTYRLSNPPPSPAIRAISRATSSRSAQPSVAGTSNPAPSLSDSRRERGRSVSEISFPISAIVTPQPPSISRSSTYHMRDPRRPPRIHSTRWIPHLKSEDEEASPIHAWLFYISFILFPVWWVASILPIPRTRVVGGSDTEKAVPLDDPQIEHDARTWRFRCRIMAGISFLTYIPFIVLVAVFASR